MKTSKLPALFFIMSFFNIGAAYASEHHSGHTGGNGGGAGNAVACTRPHLSKFLPPHLATVAPGSEFSFVAFNIFKPEQLTATVKNIPVELTAEFKDPFYLVKGKIPASLVNTAARINIKVSGKSPLCETENGWLLKIAGE